MVDSANSTRQLANAGDLLEELHTLLFTLRRGWRLIALSVVVCLTLAALILATSKRVYQATARLLIVQQGGRPLNVTNNNANNMNEGADDYIPTHMAIVTSPLVIKQAIDAVGLEELPSLNVP